MSSADRDGPLGLLGDEALEASSVVANSAMNRLRGLDGPNSYTRELGFNPLDRLTAAATTTGPDVAWLDLCCGSGRALVEAAEQLQRAGLAGRVHLVGVDLVDFFAPHPPEPAGLSMVCAPVATWVPDRDFDVVTCVHGLHYVGDKLGVLARAAGWLTDGGVLVADLDPASVRLGDGRPAGRLLLKALRAAGIEVDTRRHRVTVAGRRHVSLPYRYLGADDRAGPNYTGQPGVHSFYDVVDDRVRPEERPPPAR